MPSPSSPSTGPRPATPSTPRCSCASGRRGRSSTTDDELRVAIITGAGDKAFCAGADLGQLIPLTTGARQPANEFDEAVVADPTLGRRAMLRDWTPSKPVIAAINGHAIAGGCEIVQGTDIRVAADTARFGVQEVKWGALPARRLVGPTAPPAPRGRGDGAAADR